MTSLHLPRPAFSFLWAVCGSLSLCCVIVGPFQAFWAACSMGRRLDQRVSVVPLLQCAHPASPSLCRPAEMLAPKHSDLAGLTRPPLASTQGAARNPEDVDRERREHEREERMGQLRGSAARALPPGPPTGAPANRLRSAAEPVASTPASRIQQAGEQGPRAVGGAQGRPGRPGPWMRRVTWPRLALQAILLPERSPGWTERGR